MTSPLPTTDDVCCEERPVLSPTSVIDDAMQPEPKTAADVGRCDVMIFGSLDPLPVVSFGSTLMFLVFPFPVSKFLEVT